MTIQQDTEYQENYNPNPLNTIPLKKVERAIQQIRSSFPQEALQGRVDGEVAANHAMVQAVQRYAEANIPVDYWFLDMADFRGDKSLYKRYEQITADMHTAYDTGTRLCFAGAHGTGKTMTCACILKKAVEVGYSALYVTLTDIVTIMGSHDAAKKFDARQYLLTTDFLVVDEFDPRFMGSDNAADFYGRILEQTLRARVQNKLPIFLCTNSANPISGFSGPLKQSISSLMKLVKLVPVIGDDYRPQVIVSESSK